MYKTHMHLNLCSMLHYQSWGACVAGIVWLQMSQLAADIPEPPSHRVVQCPLGWLHHLIVRHIPTMHLRKMHAGAYHWHVELRHLVALPACLSDTS